MSDTPKRYAPAVDFPPYAFVSPYRPHPEKHPEGHSYGKPEVEVPRFEPSRWAESDRYRYGVDLFNHGYYWEAHEAWENLWHSVGRAGTAAEFLKGLIKLAAAGVKVRQGQPRGIRIHCERAADQFRSVRKDVGADRYAGMDLADLTGFADRGAADPEAFKGDPEQTVEVVFTWTMTLDG